MCVVFRKPRSNLAVPNSMECKQSNTDAADSVKQAEAGDSVAGGGSVGGDGGDSSSGCKDSKDSGGEGGATEGGSNGAASEPPCKQTSNTMGLQYLRDLVAHCILPPKGQYPIPSLHLT